MNEIQTYEHNYHQSMPEVGVGGEIAYIIIQPILICCSASAIKIGDEHFHVL